MGTSKWVYSQSPPLLGLTLACKMPGTSSQDYCQSPLALNLLLGMESGKLGSPVSPLPCLPLAGEPHIKEQKSVGFLLFFFFFY